MSLSKPVSLELIEGKLYRNGELVPMETLEGALQLHERKAGTKRKDTGINYLPIERTTCLSDLAQSHSADTSRPIYDGTKTRGVQNEDRRNFLVWSLAFAVSHEFLQKDIRTNYVGIGKHLDQPRRLGQR